jgi:spore germination cell wall hydrolase CwlJ-like protein
MSTTDWYAGVNDTTLFSAEALSLSAMGRRQSAAVHHYQPEASDPRPNLLIQSLRPAVIKDERSLTCLALNIYWEARNQSIAGQLAVAQVTLNRVLDRRYSDNVCDVVYEHKQFSWYWDGKSDVPRDSRAWQKAKLIASAALNGSLHSELQGVTHYHAAYTQPYWKNYMVKVTEIDDHIFYVN